MDDLEISGAELIDNLDKIAIINQWLGGNALTKKSVLNLMQDMAKNKVLTIADLGCGNGDMLRVLARVGEKRGYQLKLIGIDANKATVDYAIELSKEFKNIEYHHLNVLSSEFDDIEFDIALCTLFLHHFEDEMALQLVQDLHKKATVGVIVNDLHRHALAYYLFKLITLFDSNQMMRYDGQLSILKGFKRKDLEAFANKIKCKSRIRWKWAFRYEWLLYLSLIHI